MLKHDDEEKLLRSVAIQNANSILLARRRAEQELIDAKEALEIKTRELAKSLSMMRATLESTTDGIIVSDDQGELTHFNEKFAQMWQVPREIMDSRDHRRIREAMSGRFKDQQQFLARIDEIYIAALPETFDVLELADGRVFERFSKIQSIDVQTVGRVWSFRDVTQYKRLLDSERAARAESERASSMKDDFLAILSHELRTPLTAILGWARLLQNAPRDRTDFQQGLATIERNAQAQTQLIEDLLDMSRITSGKLRLDIQPLDPVTFVEAAIETVRPAADARGIRLEKMLDSATGPISGDPNRLQQVMWNLLSNAIKFTGKGGRVQVILQRVNSLIEVTVADTGIGIPTEFLPYVFERFRQADPSSTRAHGGLGLGLAIVKNLAELHGGSVAVASAGDGRGSTFTIRLPLTIVHQSSSDTERRHPRAPGSPIVFDYADLSGVRVLVVDDEPDSRDLIQRVLEECQADVLTAASSLEALEILRTGKLDILISDIGMPNIDGYELLRRVRALEKERGGKLPAIALTAFARSEDRTRALRAGFLVHMAKPVEPSELAAMVASVAGRT